MTGPAVLLTGASGFVGRAIARHLVSDGAGPVRALVRAPDAAPLPDGLTETRGDLSLPGTLARACDEVDVIVHAASYVGPDPALCSAVNERGTESLVRAARAAGVARIVYVSTASVHGRGTFRGVDCAVTPTAPGSAASASRLAAERSVLAAGGAVVRPHLIYGVGDRWFVPALTRLVTAAGSGHGDPAALQSVVHVDELGRAIGALATDAGPAGPEGTVLGGGHPEPTATADLVGTVVRDLELTCGSDRDSADRHDVAMLATDHWFDSTALWTLTGVDPGPAFPRGFRRCASWYRSAGPGHPR